MPTARRWTSLDRPARLGMIPLRNGRRAGIAIVVRMNALHSSAEANGNVHPTTKARRHAGGDNDRRRLSIIFQRPTSGMAR